MGICVIEETQLCVHTHTRTLVLTRARPECTLARARTHARFPGPAGVLISPRGCVSVDPKTL